MTAELVSIERELYHTKCQQDAMTVLYDAIERVKNGETVSIALIEVQKFGTKHSWSLLADAHKLVAGLAICQHDLIEDVRER